MDVKLFLIISCDKQSVLLLLRHGAEVGLKTDKMETPLHLAAR